MHYSLNGAIDVGQVEGAYVMGLGYFLTEELLYDQSTAALITNSTWVRLTHWASTSCICHPSTSVIVLARHGSVSSSHALMQAHAFMHVDLQATISLGYTHRVQHNTSQQ